MISLTLEEKFKTLGVKPGDSILVTSDILKFLINLKKK